VNTHGNRQREKRLVEIEFVQDKMGSEREAVYRILEEDGTASFSPLEPEASPV
jgi:hypothetical protein